MAEEQLARIARNYRDLNGTCIEEWHGTPTPLEFSRLVHISRPVVFRGGFDKLTLPALYRWTDEYLEAVMEDNLISVAVTPDGLADALKEGPDGETIYFVEPFSTRITMSQLLQALKTPILVLGRSFPDNDGHVLEGWWGGSSRAPRIFSERLNRRYTCPARFIICSGEVCYLQSQNGNLFGTDSEFGGLAGDCPSEVDWASDALDKKPEAVNLWIGNSKSTTSAHCDPYENIYTVVRGRKHFTLLPPTEGWCLREQQYPHATYHRGEPGTPLQIAPTSSDAVRWASLDPTADDLGPHACPLKVTLTPGDVLYLPTGWWHHVKQSGEDDKGGGPVVALNWWYDMEMRGMGWVWMTFLRGKLPDGPGDDEEDST